MSLFIPQFSRAPMPTPGQPVPPAFHNPPTPQQAPPQGRQSSGNVAQPPQQVSRTGTVMSPPGAAQPREYFIARGCCCQVLSEYGLRLFCNHLIESIEVYLLSLSYNLTSRPSTAPSSSTSPCSRSRPPANFTGRNTPPRCQGDSSRVHIPQGPRQRKFRQGHAC